MLRRTFALLGILSLAVTGAVLVTTSVVGQTAPAQKAGQKTAAPAATAGKTGAQAKAAPAPGSAPAGNGRERSQIERPGSPSMTSWRSCGRSPGFQSDAVWTTR